jgi:outer membrane protein OmpA-like peptidoglycan-associated protein
MFSIISKSLIRGAAVAILALAPVTLFSQVAPAAKDLSNRGTTSKWDLFVGYSYFVNRATVYGHAEGIIHGTVGPIHPVSFMDEQVGLVESATHFYNRHLGLELNSGQHDLFRNTDTPQGMQAGSSNSGMFTMQMGPFYRWRDGRLTPWVHGLVGGVSLQGPASQSYTPGVTATLGGGLDIELSRRWALRLGEGNYEYVHVNYGSPYLGSDGQDWDEGGLVNIHGFRFAAGIVYHIGSTATSPPVTLTCSANPTTVFPGDPVMVTAVAGGLNPKLNTVYSFSGNGVSGKGATATVATASLAPGTYTVKCGVKVGKPGKEGLKPWETADAATNFTVKAFEPPTISCSANPGTIKPGEASAITASGVSPQNRPLTYSYSATAGTMEGSGTNAIFNSTGAPTGVAGITCNVSDDKGQTATANTSVIILAPYVAPAPHSQALCSISFATDKQRPERVDNEAKACLDGIALALQKQSDAKVVLVGNSDAKEKAKLAMEQKAALKNKHLKVVDPAAERAVNAKDYLVKEKGIDASRVGVVTGKEDGQTVENYLVPSGASFVSDVPNTSAVDESAVKAQPRKPITAQPHKKVAAKPAVK